MLKVSFGFILTIYIPFRGLNISIIGNWFRFLQHYDLILLNSNASKISPDESL